jgi:uncharacterized protein
MSTLYNSNTGGTLRDEVTRSRVTFVLKTSKLCNLRCQYCYEFPELSNAQVIDRLQLQSMYRHIAEHYSHYEMPVDIEFAWHGGEPLLLGADFYWETLDDQTKVFDDERITVTNLVQTNLWVIDDRLIKLLHEGFDGVGVSIDLFSGLRVSSTGKDSQDRVLQNMDWLQKSGVDFGCITVLSKQNVGHATKIFKFFQRGGISFRLLPVFRGATDTQNNSYSLTPVQVLESFKEFFELWIESPTPIIIEPLFTYTENLLAARLSEHQSWSKNANWYRYDKASWESIYIVNTDGNLYSYADIYNTQLSHGNIFQYPLSELIHSSGHRRAIDAAEARIKTVCPKCKHFGHGCGGYPAAEESPNSGEVIQNGTVSCVKDQGILDYIEQRLCEIGIIDPINGQVNIPPNYKPRFVRGL